MSARVAAAVEPASRRGRRAVRVECFGRPVALPVDGVQRMVAATLVMDRIRRRGEAAQESRAAGENPDR